MARELIEPPVAERWLRMTYDEWLAWDSGETRSEWVDGEVIAFMPTSRRHGRLVLFLASLLESFVGARRLGEVQARSIAMRLERAGRVPDVWFVARDHLDRLTDTQVLGPADLVIEVVSEDSDERDRMNKFAEYAAAGVPEYWLVESRPGHRGAEFYHLVDGAYRAAAPEADGRYHSLVVPGFWLRPAWLERDPIPNALDCLVEIAPDLIAAALARTGAAPGGDGETGSR